MSSPSLKRTLKRPQKIKTNSLVKVFQVKEIESDIEFSDFLNNWKIRKIHSTHSCMQGPPKPKRKNQENTARDSQHSETSNAWNQKDLLDISTGNISDPEISTQNKSIIETKNPMSPFFDKFKTFIIQNNCIIIAGDKYNDTPQINQSFDDTVGDITLREKSIFVNVTANSTLYDRTLYPNLLLLLLLLVCGK